MARQSTALFIRGMRPSVVREAKAIAAKRGTTLAKLVTDSLERAFDAETDAEDLHPIEESMRWYERHRRRLVRRYAGKYVAIHDGNVIDSDTSFGQLAMRVFDRFGARSIFMPRVTASDRIVRIRSPRKSRS